MDSDVLFRYKTEYANSGNQKTDVCLITFIVTVGISSINH